MSSNNRSRPSSAASSGQSVSSFLSGTSYKSRYCLHSSASSSAETLLMSPPQLMDPATEVTCPARTSNSKHSAMFRRKNRLRKRNCGYVSKRKSLGSHAPSQKTCRNLGKCVTSNRNRGCVSKHATSNRNRCPHHTRSKQKEGIYVNNAMNRKLGRVGEIKGSHIHCQQNHTVTVSSRPKLTRGHKILTRSRRTLHQTSLTKLI